MTKQYMFLNIMLTKVENHKIIAVFHVDHHMKNRNFIFLL